MSPGRCGASSETDHISGRFFLFSEVVNIVKMTVRIARFFIIVSLVTPVLILNCATQEKPTHMSSETSENQTEMLTYIVAFNTMTQEHRHQVINMEGVKYIKNAVSDLEGYPAIIISADAAAVETIRKLDFVHAVVRAEISPDTIPKISNLEHLIFVITKLACPIIVVAILVMSTIAIIFFKKKRGSTH